MNVGRRGGWGHWTCPCALRVAQSAGCLKRHTEGHTEFGVSVLRWALWCVLRIRHWTCPWCTLFVCVRSFHAKGLKGLVPSLWCTRGFKETCRPTTYLVYHFETFFHHKKGGGERGKNEHGAKENGEAPSNKR